MPANPKHLEKSKWQRFAKVSAAILGSLLITITTMLAMVVWVKEPRVIFKTFSFLFFIQWCTLMLLAFLFKNGWKCWLLYGVSSLILVAIYFMGTINNPGNI